MSLDPISAGLDLVGTLIQRFFPDKTAEEQARLAAALTVVQGQMAINQEEAKSSDPLQHWRGGLGWVCVAGYACHFVARPIVDAISISLGHPIIMPELDMGSLSTLTLGMLGLGSLHVAEKIKAK